MKHLILHSLPNIVRFEILTKHRESVLWACFDTSWVNWTRLVLVTSYRTKVAQIFGNLRSRYLDRMATKLEKVWWFFSNMWSAFTASTFIQQRFQNFLKWKQPILVDHCCQSQQLFSIHICNYEFWIVFKQKELKNGQ